MDLNLNQMIYGTSKTLTDTYQTLISSTYQSLTSLTGKSYQRKDPRQCIRVLKQLTKVTRAMLKYTLSDFPPAQVILLINATKQTEFYFDCASEISLYNVHLAKRILHIQIEAHRLKRLVRRQLTMLDDLITVTFKVL